MKKCMYARGIRTTASKLLASGLWLSHDSDEIMIESMVVDVSISFAQDQSIGSACVRNRVEARDRRKLRNIKSD